MAHSHYVIDLFYPADGDPEHFRRDVLRIEAMSDSDAEVEGRRIGAWRRPAYFLVRAIKTTARSNDLVVFDSRGEDKAVATELASEGAADAT